MFRKSILAVSMGATQRGINVKKSMLVVLFTSLVLGLSACGGGSNDSDAGSDTDGGSGDVGDTGTGGDTDTGGDTGTVTGLSTVDFEKQVYIKKVQNGEDSATALAFHSGGTGENFDNDGEGTFAWSISNNKLDLGTSDGNNVSIALKSKTDNKYTFTISEPSGTFESEFFQAKPLTLADLDGKILAFDVSDDADCSAHTIKITGNTVSMKDVCTDGNSEATMTLSAVSSLDNTLQLDFTGENGDPRSTMMVLIEGSIAQSGTVAFIHKENNVFTEVEINTITATTTEASGTDAPVVIVDQNFRVVDQKLMMKSISTTGGEARSASTYYGLKDDVHFDSLEADVALTDEKITGDARARIGLVLHMKSATDEADVYMAIDSRVSEIEQRAYLTINGVQSEIPGIHKQAIVAKGTSYKFKMETPADSPVLRLTLGSSTTDIAFSSIPSGMTIDSVRFFTNVKFPQAGDFSKGTIDNVVLKLTENGTPIIKSYNFDDGITPTPDAYFNDVYGSNP